MRVAVLKGGRSLERHVSLRSGEQVERALERLGHEPKPIDVDASLVERLGDLRPAVAFIALHGKDGEDGAIQEVLEILGIPYTGSGVLASMLSNDKSLAKRLFQQAGIPTPEFFAFNQTAFRELGAGSILPVIEDRLRFPIVVKPASQGSALGIRFARRAEDVPSALVAAFSYDDKVIVERYVGGRDLAVGILEIEGEMTALPVVEAVPKEEDFYDFSSRYEIGKTDFFCPADVPKAVSERAAEIAIESMRVLGVRGWGRVDMMLGRDDDLEVLEAHTIPGLTSVSLLPQAAEAAGIGFDDLIDRILHLALSHTRGDR